MAAILYFKITIFNRIPEKSFKKLCAKLYQKLLICSNFRALTAEFLKT